MKLNKIIILGLITIISLSISSCKKSEGDGGKATITGKLMVTRYNTIGVAYPDPYAGAYEDVYIIYGNDSTYGKKVSANPDGVYEFKYLRQGHYKIYSYSSGTSVTTANRVAVIKEVEITAKKQAVECETINIAR